MSPSPVSCCVMELKEVTNYILWSLANTALWQQITHTCCHSHSCQVSACNFYCHLFLVWGAGLRWPGRERRGWEREVKERGRTGKTVWDHDGTSQQVPASPHSCLQNITQQTFTRNISPSSAFNDQTSYKESQTHKHQHYNTDHLGFLIFSEIRLGRTVYQKVLKRGKRNVPEEKNIKSLGLHLLVPTISAAKTLTMDDFSEQKRLKHFQDQESFQNSLIWEISQYIIGQ